MTLKDSGISDDQIDRQIDRMKESGIKFHFDRKKYKERLKDKTAFLQKGRGKIRKSYKYFLLLILVACTVLVYVSRRDSGKNITLTGSDIVMNIEKIFTSDDVLFRVTLTPKQEAYKISPGDAVYFYFKHNKGLVVKREIVSDVELTITPSKPVKQIVTISKGELFRSVYYEVISDAFGFHDKIRLR